jgi:hypothetical protein
MAAPWENDPIVQPVQGGGGLRQIVAPQPDLPSAQTPEQAEADRLRNEMLGLQIQQQKDKLAETPAGKPLPAWAAKPYEDQIGIYAGLASAADNFQDEFGGNTVTGGLENSLQGLYGGFGSEGQRDWWAAFRQNDNVIRNQLFGATLTPSEQRAYAATSISERMDPTEIRRNLQSRREIVRKALARKTSFFRAQGYNDDAISALAGEYAGDFAPEGQQSQNGGDEQPPAAGDVNGAGDAPPQNLTPSPDGSETFSTPQDLAFAQEAQALFDRGGSREDLNALAVARGYEPYGGDLDRAIAYRNQGGKGARIGAPVSGYRPPTTVATLANSPVGAYFGGAANALTAGTIDELSSDPERAQMAKEAMREAHPWASAAGELTGGALALTGAGRVPGLATRGLAVDTAYGAAYGAGENNENRIGGGVTGGVAALTGSYFGGKLLNRFNGPRPPSQGARRVEGGKEFGIDVPMGAVGGRGAAIIDNTLSNMPGSAQVMQGGRDALSGQVENAVGDMADNFGATASFQSMGEAAQRGAKNWINRFQATADKAYDAIPISAKAAADLSNTRASLSELTGRYASNPKLAEALQNPRLSKLMDALGEATSQLSWKDLKALRSRIGEEIGDHRFSDGTLTSELRGLYGALSEDMRATAVQQGPAALRKFERANDLYRQGQERIDGALKSILGDDSKLRPEAAAATIQRIARAGKSSSDVTKLAELRKSLPAEEWGEVSNGIIRLLGQPVNSEGRQFSAETFIKSFDDMSPEARNLLFGGENKDLRQKLDRFVEVLRPIANRNSLRNSSNTAGQVLTGFGFYSLGNLPALIGQGVGSYGAAKLWTNPRFVEWATGYAKMVKGAQRAGGAPTNARQVALLKKVAAAEPAIQAEASGLANLLAANDNALGSAAASEGSEPDQQRAE